jgi:hypothetical protein
MRLYDPFDSPPGSNPGEDEIFNAIQNGLLAHPASCTVRTRSFPGAKRPDRGVDHPPPLVPIGKLVGATFPPSLYAGSVTFTFESYQCEKINGPLELEYNLHVHPRICCITCVYLDFR